MINSTDNIEKTLYRFGEFKYIYKSLMEGEFRIKSAIDFTKDEYNKARKDNEHIHEMIIPRSNVKINKEIKISSDIFQTSFDRNLSQYILCMSFQYNEELYDEFEADACLIIKNVREFENRLMLEMERQYPQLLGIGNRVFYNINSFQHPLGVMFTKKIDYMMQKEYRYLWRNDNNPVVIDEESLVKNNFFISDNIIPKPLTIRIGNIQDIAEVITK